MTIHERLEIAVKEIDGLRTSLIFDEDISDCGFDFLATQEYLQSTAFLQLARDAMQKAVILQSRALAQSPMRHL